MIVRFENLISGKNFTRHLSHNEVKSLETRVLWSVDDVIYWVNKIIKFDAHYNVIVSPLYAWSCIVSDNDCSIFDMVEKDNVYKEKLTDKLCLRHFKTQPGMSDRSGDAVYLEVYEYKIMPKLVVGDAFVFDNVSYIVKSFEVHRRMYGPQWMDRVVVVTHDIRESIQSDTTIVSDKHSTNPLDIFLRGFSY